MEGLITTSKNQIPGGGYMYIISNCGLSNVDPPVFDTLRYCHTYFFNKAGLPVSTSLVFLFCLTQTVTTYTLYSVLSTVVGRFPISCGLKLLSNLDVLHCTEPATPSPYHPLSSMYGRLKVCCIRTRVTSGRRVI